MSNFTGSVYLIQGCFSLSFRNTDFCSFHLKSATENGCDVLDSHRLAIVTLVQITCVVPYQNRNPAEIISQQTGKI